MKKKSTIIKKAVSIAFTLFLIITMVPVSQASTNWSSLINSQKLTPEKTGYSVLDNEVESVLNSLISKGYNTPADLSRESYKYLIKSVGYRGKDPISKDYPQKPIPSDNSTYIENMNGDFKAMLSI